MDSSEMTDKGNTDLMSPLPPELKLHILSYIGHADLLHVRLACKSLNNLIRDWKVFQDKTEFILRFSRGENNDSKYCFNVVYPDPETLLFNHLVLHDEEENELKLDFQFEDPINKILAYKNNLKSLTFRGVALSWIHFQRFIIQFENLNSFAFIDCLLKDEGSELPELIEFCQNNLKKLKIENSSFRELVDFWFTRFSNVPKLESIEIILKDHEFDKNIFTTKFPKLLESASESLSSFYFTNQFDFDFPFAFDFDEYFLEKRCDWNFQLKRIKSFHLQTNFLPEVVSMSFPWFQENCVLDHVLTHANQLKKLVLPRQWHIHNRQYLMNKMPKTIECLSVTVICGNPNYYEIFPKFRELEIQFDVADDPKVFTGFCFPQIQILTLRFWYNQVSLEIIGKVFPSLIALKIENSKFENHHLQQIIGNFKSLKILSIRTMHKWFLVDDSGITGLEPKEITIGDDELEKRRVGLPLSNLKDLTELYISCANGISDIGVNFGMRFGSKMNKITFGGCNKITSNGISLLKKYNPTITLKFLDKKFAAAGSSDSCTCTSNMMM